MKHDVLRKVALRSYISARKSELFYENNENNLILIYLNDENIIYDDIMMKGTN